MFISDYRNNYISRCVYSKLPSCRFRRRNYSRAIYMVHQPGGHPIVVWRQWAPLGATTVNELISLL